MSGVVSQLNVSRRAVMEIAIDCPPMLLWDGIERGELLASLKWNRGVGLEKLEARRVDGSLVMTYSHQIAGNKPVVANVNAYRFCLLWIQGCGKSCHVPAIKLAAEREIHSLPQPKKVSDSRFRAIQDHLLDVAWLSLH